MCDLNRIFHLLVYPGPDFQGHILIGYKGLIKIIYESKSIGVQQQFLLTESCSLLQLVEFVGSLR